jgi:predicted lipid-binding transport protein (Tim44 family)
MVDLMLFGAASYLLSRNVQRHQPQLVDAGARRWRATTPIVLVPAEVRAPADATNLRSAVAEARKSDRDFYPEGVERAATECFRLVLTALVLRDAGNIRTRLTPEMYSVLKGQAGDLKAARRFRHVERLDIDSARLDELWQERGQDFATVHLVSRLIDYTTDAAGAVVLGSKTTLSRIEQRWTFTRPMGPYAWRLAAIEQR